MQGWVRQGWRSVGGTGGWISGLNPALQLSTIKTRRNDGGLRRSRRGRLLSAVMVSRARSIRLRIVIEQSATKFVTALDDGG